MAREAVVGPELTESSAERFGSAEAVIAASKIAALRREGYGFMQVFGRCRPYLAQSPGMSPLRWPEHSGL